MAQKGLELIVGVTRDAQFGPVVMFGLGGVFVETIRDVVFRAVPVAREDAQEMLADIRFKAMLEGTRGLAPVDKAAIVDLLLKVSALAQAHPEIARDRSEPGDRPRRRLHGRGCADDPGRRHRGVAPPRQLRPAKRRPQDAACTPPIDRRRPHRRARRHRTGGLRPRSPSTAHRIDR